ncbi:MAG: helix-turn-helix transcriptional regulator [Clostridiaceae bacterium]|nr:helix-turn-helix transcriptional regulator [Clostridiaceae bacterium]
MFSSLVDGIDFIIPPWPEFITSSYRYFRQDEKHVTRVCKSFVLLFMLERTLYFTEDGHDISVKAGEWYIQVPGLRQEGRRGSPAPSYYYIHFKALACPAGCNGNEDKTMNKGYFTLPVRGKFDAGQFKPLFDQLEYISKRRPYDILGKQAVFLSILDNLMCMEWFSSFGRNDFLVEVMDYLAENFNKPVTSADLARKFNFSADYIARKMKQYSGITPNRRIQQLKIEKAKQLLANTDHTLAFIAQEVGYNDLSVFYKAFRKQTGIAPGKWRQKNRI